MLWSDSHQMEKSKRGSFLSTARLLKWSQEKCDRNVKNCVTEILGDMTGVLVYRRLNKKHFEMVLNLANKGDTPDTGKPVKISHAIRIGMHTPALFWLLSTLSKLTVLLAICFIEIVQNILHLCMLDRRVSCILNFGWNTRRKETTFEIEECNIAVDLKGKGPILTF